MPILSIRHVTTYHYQRPVAFGAHRMMLRPRDDGDQKVIHSEIEITPRPRRLAWKRDAFGNHVATADFADRADALCFVSDIRIDHAPACFHAAAITDFARLYPFRYADEDWPLLARFAEPPPSHTELDCWSAAFLRTDGSADTHDLLVGMTQTIRRTFKHVARHEKGIQTPIQTLELRTGSCRDLAVLMIAALRARGFAARFVSGYLHLPDDEEDEADDLEGGNTHAWVQVYVPGPGWVDFDPSGGIVGNRNLIRVAVVHDPCDAIPLQGTWFGSASDHLAMKVAVKVKAVALTDAGLTSAAADRTESR